MRFVTVEFQRFGGSTGQLSQDNSYLRTVGVSGPVCEVPGPLDAHLFERLMSKIDHSVFKLGVDRTTLLENGKLAAAHMRVPIRTFVDGESITPGDPEELVQLEIVTHASELAMVPFEVLEDDQSALVVTRRLRRPDVWPKTVHPVNGRPRVLFAWSEAFGVVPHEEHRVALQEICDEFGGVLHVVENATLTKITEMLAAAGDSPYSHVHLLAHGIEAPEEDPLLPVDVSRPSGPPFLLGLDEPVTPAALAAAFEVRSDRPSVVTLAACDAARVDPAIGAYSFAHALHAAGVHVVVASQFPLTKKGSIALVRHFIARSVEGEDPRAALRETRQVLRSTGSETYFDHLAVVGYIHLNDDADFTNSAGRALAASLSKLRTTKARLDEAIDDSGADEARLTEVRSSYADVRRDLSNLMDGTLSDAETEECLGLIASSLKREAEAVNRYSYKVPVADGGAWREQSMALLKEALVAYSRAADCSLDNHWAWMQWLALEAVVDSGAAAQREGELHVVRLAANRSSGGREWSIGTLLEVWVLSAALGGDTSAPVNVNGLVDELDELCSAAANDFALTSTLDQMRRYTAWWSAPEWGIHPGVAARAAEVEAALTARVTGR